MPRELTSCCFGGNIKWLLLKVCLRAKEPFSFERFTRRKKMNPIVRVALFAGVSFLTIVVLLCVAWWCLVAFLAYYCGALESAAFALGSISLPVLIYGMKHHRR